MRGSILFRVMAVCLSAFVLIFALIAVMAVGSGTRSLTTTIAADGRFDTVISDTPAISGPSIVLLSAAGLSLLAVLLFFAVRGILKPIKELTRIVGMMEEGNLQSAFDRPAGAGARRRPKDEISAMSAALTEMLRQLGELQELKLQALEAEYEKEQAEASARAKSDFLAKMSHEIRTPMNAIIGMAELVLREDIPPTAYEHVLTIKQAGTNLLSIINDVLDFSKIEKGKLVIVQEEYLFASLLNDVISLIRMQVIEARLRFIVNIDGNLPNRLFGDEVKIRQVLLNILGNAVKYTSMGFVTFTVSGKIIDDETVLLAMEVADSGKGIKKEDLGKLFEHFVQFGAEDNKGIEGTGLGLAISRSIVDGMGGGIAVASEFGKGSTFTVTLPQIYRSPEKLAEVHDAKKHNVLVYERRNLYANSIVGAIQNLGVPCTLVTTDQDFHCQISQNRFSFIFVSSALYENVEKARRQIDTEAKIVLLAEFGEAPPAPCFHLLAMPVHSVSVAAILNGATGSFHYMAGSQSKTRFRAPSAKILVVDDIMTNLKVTEGLLLPYNLQIDLCKNGLDAIEAVKSTPYDLVFMDHMMPGINGLEATRRIRELNDRPHCKTMPIVALTANVVQNTREMFMQNGFDDFLSKPIDTAALDMVLERWIPKIKQLRATQMLRGGADDAKQELVVDIEGIDTAKGIAMTGGTAESYLDTLAVFYRDGLEKIAETNECLRTEKLALYAIHIHALKGAAAGIGAAALAETAKRLEKAAKSGNMEFIRMNHKKLISSLESLLDKIHNVTANRRKRSEPVNMETLRVALCNLREALRDLDSGAMDSASGVLREFTHWEETGSVLETILQNVLIGDYEDAIERIDLFLRRDQV